MFLLQPVWVQWWCLYASYWKWHAKYTSLQTHLHLTLSHGCRVVKHVSYCNRHAKCTTHQFPSPSLWFISSFNGRYGHAKYIVQQLWTSYHWPSLRSLCNGWYGHAMYITHHCQHTAIWGYVHYSLIQDIKEISGDVFDIHKTVICISSLLVWKGLVCLVQSPVAVSMRSIDSIKSISSVS